MSARACGLAHSIPSKHSDCLGFRARGHETLYGAAESNLRAYLLDLYARQGPGLPIGFWHGNDSDRGARFQRERMLHEGAGTVLRLIQGELLGIILWLKQ